MAYTEREHRQKVEEFKGIAQKLVDLYDAKNLDYGDSFGKSFAEWGLPMAAIRLTDKLNRLSSFAKGQDMKVKDEAIEDTLMDLANYSIMTLIELQREKEKQNG